MTTQDSFRVVAACAAALAIIGYLLPARDGNSARRVASLGVLCGAWVLLAGSLLTHADATALWNRLDSPARIGGAALALLVIVAVAVVLVRLVIARPRAWLVLLALALPVRVPVTVGTQNANLLLPLYAVIAIGVIAVAVRAMRGSMPAISARTGLIDVPLAFFAAFALVSTAWSADITEATAKMVFFYIPFVVLYRLLIAWWPIVDRPLRTLVATTVTVAVGVALIALAQYATRSIWWNDTLKQGNIYNRFFRANGIFYDPNILGRFLVVAIVAAVAYLVVSDERTHAAILSAAVVVMAAGLVVTFSRSSALALLVALSLLALRAFGVRRTLVVGIGALLLIGGPAVALNQNVREKATSIDRLAGSGEGRLRLVKGGVELWRDAPVAGVGLGGFAERYKETLSRRDQLKTRVFISHTAPVTVLAETGAIGFGLLVALCVAALTAMGRGARRDDVAGLAVWTMLALVVAIFVHSVLYSAFFEDPYVWVIVAAAGALAAAPARTRADEDGATRGLPQVAPLAGG